MRSPTAPCARLVFDLSYHHSVLVLLWNISVFNTSCVCIFCVLGSEKQWRCKRHPASILCQHWPQGESLTNYKTAHKSAVTITLPGQCKVVHDESKDNKHISDGVLLWAVSVWYVIYLGPIYSKIVNKRSLITNKFTHSQFKEYLYISVSSVISSNLGRRGWLNEGRHDD